MDEILFQNTYFENKKLYLPINNREKLTEKQIFEIFFKKLLESMTIRKLFYSKK